MKRTALVLVLLASLASAAAADQGSVERGKELFNSPSLGTNGKSCATCHPNGSKLKDAPTGDEQELIQIINGCIKKPLAGKPLPVDSADMKSLVMYIRTFAQK